MNTNGERYTERFWTSIKPRTQPASTCATCFKPGSVSADQTEDKRNGKPLATIRFECTSGHAWTVNARDAEAHGRFLAKLERTP